MAGWAGFSEEDVLKIKQSIEPHSLTPGAQVSPMQLQVGMPPGAQVNSAMVGHHQQGGKQQVRFTQQQGTRRKPMGKEKAFKQQKSNGASANIEIDPNQSLSKSAEKHCTVKPDDSRKPKQVECGKERVESTSKSSSTISENKGQTAELVQENARIPDGIEELDEEEGINREISNLEKFQQQQKLIEAQNAKRRQMLTQAISERKKRTHAEQQKLLEIQKDLGHLDTLLTVDVSLLRDKIEDASREYSDAQKRYDKAEKEFIEAKLELHKRSEHKEQLTEHLYAIIQANELRKATKLSELMEKLNMDIEVESEIQSLIPPIPTSPPAMSPSVMTTRNGVHTPADAKTTRHVAPLISSATPSVQCPQFYKKTMACYPVERNVAVCDSAVTSEQLVKPSTAEENHGSVNEAAAYIVDDTSKAEDKVTIAADCSTEKSEPSKAEGDDGQVDTHLNNSASMLPANPLLKPEHEVQEATLTNDEESHPKEQVSSDVAPPGASHGNELVLKVSACPAPMESQPLLNSSNGNKAELGEDKILKKGKSKPYLEAFQGL
ncbi:PREDICTED: RAB6-interacting golgin-like isoform X3 [Priapulus caudatus]|uniref:RAB6-interacting golgin n=1 Tax=Priapulus caudatus TaxID=37621 RepID=A0ABM1EQ99_PRICU|nr:PREDICTED: RAB6-interacting golgin-like isoform X3 [Priapulus caudatus]